MSSATPPGWYPDPSGLHGTRWWDGGAWTEHVGSPPGPEPRRRLADGVPTDTLWIWVTALLPLVSIPLAFVYQPHPRFEVVGPSHLRTIDPLSVYTPGYVVVQGVGLLLYAAYVVLALFDVRALRRRGVVRPFPWPWAFLAAPVYVIGRYVVLRKVAPGRPMWPLWTYLALIVVGSVVGIGRTVALFHQMLP